MTAQDAIWEAVEAALREGMDAVTFRRVAAEAWAQVARENAERDVKALRT